jgi:catecholate siderophore receptor
LLETTDKSQLGRQLPNAPPHAFSLWTTYGIAPGWEIGGGVTFNSNTFANAQNTEYAPAYWKFDAMASYKVNNYASLQLNIYNITNELYYSEYYSGQGVPAPGRYAALSLKVKY